MSIRAAFAVLDQQARLGVTEFHEAVKLWPNLMALIADQYPLKRYPPGVQRRLKRMSRKHRDRAVGFDQAEYNARLLGLIQSIRSTAL